MRFVEHIEMTSLLGLQSCHSASEIDLLLRAAYTMDTDLASIHQKNSTDRLASAIVCGLCNSNHVQLGGIDCTADKLVHHSVCDRPFGRHGADLHRCFTQNSLS